MSELGGIDVECKLKNSGDCSTEVEFDYFKKYEHLKGLQILAK